MDSDQRGGWGPLAEPIHPDRPITPADPPWRENAWLAFYDRPQGIYGVTHVTTSPNSGGLTDGAGIELTVERPEARIFVPLGEPTTSAALSAYDDFAEVRTADGAVGFGAIEQGILRRLG